MYHDFDEKPEVPEGYTCFKDSHYFYIAHESVHEQMKRAGRTMRMYLASIVISLETGKVVKSRFFGVRSN